MMPDSSKDKVRPFPWHCPRCKERKVQLQTISYRAERRQNGEMVAVQIAALRIPICAHCGELLFTINVDEQIKQAFQEQAQSIKRQPAITG